MADLPPLPDAVFRVALDGSAMHLRRSELEAVASGLGEFDASEEGNVFTLAEALQRLPMRDRAPTWELAVRRYGHRKPIEQAAGEIGLDAVHARELLARLTHEIGQITPPEHAPGLAAAAAEVEPSPVARFMAQEILGNAIAHDEAVDLDAAHEASLRAVEELKSEP